MKTDLEILREVCKMKPCENQIKDAKEFLDELIKSGNDEAKSIYMAGEINLFQQALPALSLARLDERERLNEYVRHKEECNVSNWVDRVDAKCNCGLDDLNYKHNDLHERERMGHGLKEKIEEVLWNRSQLSNEYWSRTIVDSKNFKDVAGDILALLNPK